MKDVRLYLVNRIKMLDMAIDAATADIRHLFEIEADDENIRSAQYFRDGFHAKRDAFQEILDFINMPEENQS